jgi:hypothetical protein
MALQSPSFILASENFVVGSHRAVDEASSVGVKGKNLFEGTQLAVPNLSMPVACGSK